MFYWLSYLSLSIFIIISICYDISESFYLFEFLDPWDSLNPFDLILTGVYVSIYAAYPCKLRFYLISIILGFIKSEFYAGCL
jgi:hypothetical protein